jgi:branched-subunit amino acid ABC-type transport system permease component
MKTAVYRYLVTLIAVAVAAVAAWFLYQKYVTDPWIGQTVTVAILPNSSPIPEKNPKQP